MAKRAKRAIRETKMVMKMARMRKTSAPSCSLAALLSHLSMQGHCLFPACSRGFFEPIIFIIIQSLFPARLVRILQNSPRWGIVFERFPERMPGCRYTLTREYDEFMEEKRPVYLREEQASKSSVGQAGAAVDVGEQAMLEAAKARCTGTTEKDQAEGNAEMKGKSSSKKDREKDKKSTDDESLIVVEGDVVCFYWRFSKLKNGWWMGRKFGSTDGIMAFCPKTSMRPPKSGWQVICRILSQSS